MNWRPTPWKIKTEAKKKKNTCNIRVESYMYFK